MSDFDERNRRQGPEEILKRLDTPGSGATPHTDAIPPELTVEGGERERDGEPVVEGQPTASRRGGGPRLQEGGRAPGRLGTQALALFLAGALTGGVAGGVAASSWGRRIPPAPFRLPMPTQPAPVPLGQAEGTRAIPAVYERVAPAVVAIKVAGGRDRTGQGSGFVVDDQGHILTNHHVVEGASQITVQFSDGTRLEGKVAGSDRYLDLAVVKVDSNVALTVAALGDSDQVRPGELAIAIGNPYGHTNSVTAGIISAVNRTLREENNPFGIHGTIQTDAPINPGNSGGPLLNAAGQVVGINTAIEAPVRGSVGIGFAVPINAARRVLPYLIAGQKVEYAWLGVSLDDLTPEMARQLGTQATEGAVVIEVYDQSPADRAGIRSAGMTRRGAVVSADVITAVDGRPLKGADELVRYLVGKQPGEQVTLTVLRGAESRTVKVTLAPRPEKLEAEEE